MKKILIITIILLFSNTADAEFRGQMELYVGSPCDGRVCIYSPDGQLNYSIEMWIWFFPSEHGLSCVEFAISYPDNVIQGDVTINPDYSVTTGTLAEGMTICFKDCVWDNYQWTHHQTLIVTDLNPSTIRIIAHPNAYPEPDIWFLNCDIRPTRESCSITGGLYLNHCGVGIQSSNWGAIKSLYKD